MGVLRSALRPGVALALVREVRASRRDSLQLVLGGAPELVRALQRELARGGIESAIRIGGPPATAVALLHVVAAEPTEADEAALRAATRAAVPVVVLLAGPAAVLPRVPGIASSAAVVRAQPGQGFPLAELAAALARRTGEAGAGLAARLPVVREAVCAELVRRAARNNAVVAVLPRGPADQPLLTLNQARLVLWLAQAHGIEVSAERLPELLAVLGASLGFRAAARELVGLVPVAGWAVKSVIAWGATRALGEAAIRRFSAQAPVRRTPAEPRELR